MATKIKLKGLFSDIIKKLKLVEKSNPELNVFGVLFELSSCHVIPLEEIHKTLAKIKNFYMDFNEFRVTEIDDICKDFNMPDRADDLLTYIECLDSVFEKNGKVDLFDISKYDDQKISDLFSRLSTSINGNCYSYYLNRLGKEGPFVFNENQIKILKRLKIVEETEEPEAIRKKIEKVFPAEKAVSFFLACQVHANEFCREENPSCSRCPFLNDCDFGKNVVKERDEKQKERELVKQRALEEEQRKIENEKKKAKVSTKKKDKNDGSEDTEAVEVEDPNATPVLSKREQKKLLRAKEAEEKAALKIAAKLAKKKMKEDAKLAQIAANALKAEEAKKLKKAKAEEALKAKEPKKITAKEKKLLEKAQPVKVVAAPPEVKPEMPVDTSKVNKKTKKGKIENIVTVIPEPIAVKASGKSKDKAETSVTKNVVLDKKSKKKKEIPEIEVAKPAVKSISKKSEKIKSEIKSTKKEIVVESDKNKSNKKVSIYKKEIKLEKQIKKMPIEKSKPVTNKKESVVSSKTGKNKPVAKVKSVPTKATVVKSAKKSKEAKGSDKKKPVKKVDNKKKK